MGDPDVVLGADSVNGAAASTSPRSLSEDSCSSQAGTSHPKSEKRGMVRRVLRPVVTVATTLAVMAGALLAVGVWRGSEDTKWCEKAVMGGTVLGDEQLVAADVLEQQRSACAIQRQRQRVLFGAMWRKGGTAAAQCGFDLARLQLLSAYPEAREAILQTYGIDDPNFDGGGLQQQDRFVKACIANGRHEAG
jgi:hypothetical protein